MGEEKELKEGDYYIKKGQFVWITYGDVTVCLIGTSQTLTVTTHKSGEEDEVEYERIEHIVEVAR